jgi:mono/diheme cytochrome c family protein
MKNGMAAMAPIFRSTSRPQIGPGQQDAFNVIGLAVFPAFGAAGLARPEVVGTADFPAVWRRPKKQALQPRVHWDGNQACTVERDNAAAVSLGALPSELELGVLENSRAWAETTHAPKLAQFGVSVDRALAAKGLAAFKAKCADCHAEGGTKVGAITPIGEVQTDEGRLNVVAPGAFEAFERMAATSEYADYRNSHGGKSCLEAQAGYMNRVLAWKKDGREADAELTIDNVEGDALFLAGPYLHNGSVPTLWHLLQSDGERPASFCRGSDLLDTKQVGFSSFGAGCVEPAGPTQGKRYFRVDARFAGGPPANRGHNYGTDLSNEEKWALVEFLKLL